MVLGFFMLIDTCLIPFESKKHCFKTLNNNFQNCLYFHFRKFFQEFLVISSDSSQIVVEDKGNYFLGGDRMNTTNTFITVPEIQEVLSVSESKAYRIVRKLNEELKQKGYMVIPCRVSRHYFIERFYGMNVEEGGNE